jgi:hypothetical protein
MLGHRVEIGLDERGSCFCVRILQEHRAKGVPSKISLEGPVDKRLDRPFVGLHFFRGRLSSEKMSIPGIIALRLIRQSIKFTHQR